MIDDFDITDYLDGAVIYTKEHPAGKSLKLENESDEAYIPRDVLEGKREWNLVWIKIIHEIATEFSF